MNKTKDTISITLDNKYKLNQLLGWGAHGEVYHAENIKTGEILAVKIFFSDREDVLRFVQKELATISKLSHPNLLPFKDFGECVWKGESVHYITTPYMEGGNLASVIKKRGAFSLQQTMVITLQLIKALSYMHTQEHLHKDIKPANILLDNEGNVVLADFSIACSPDNPSMGPIGTPEYCAPEQIIDDTTWHPRIDVYGLGTAMYEMLSGENPFRKIQKQKGQAAAFQKKCLDDIPFLSDTVKTIPYSLSSIIHKMMSYDPVERYQNMEEVMQALIPFFDSSAEIFGETIPVTEKQQTVFIPKEKGKNVLKQLKNLILELWDKRYILSLLFFQIRKKLTRETIELDEMFQRAYQAKRSKSWKKAIKLYQYILFENPFNAKALNHQGDIWIKLKKYKKALKLLHEAILINPKYYSAYCNRGFVYIQFEKLERAMQDYDVAIALEKEKPEAFFYRANTWLKVTKRNLKEERFIEASKSYQYMQKDLQYARKLSHKLLKSTQKRQQI